MLSTWSLVISKLFRFLICVNASTSPEHPRLFPHLLKNFRTVWFGWLQQTSCNRIRWCSLSFKSCWSSDQHWLEICFEVKFSFSKLKKKTLIMIYSWAGLKIEPGSDVWVATPKWCLRPHWTAHHHQPSNSFLIQMYKKFKIDAKLLTMLKRRMPKPHTVRGSALAIQFQAKKREYFCSKLALDVDVYSLIPVSLANNPFWRSIHPRPLILELVLLHQEAARAKVDEEDLVGVEVDHQVLVLHVLVNNSTIMAGSHHVQHL